MKPVGYRLMKQLRLFVFISMVVGLAAAISCTKLGPVPDFEYTYDFDAQLPDIDINGLQAETVNITPGSIDSEEFSNLATTLSNPTTASNYASAVNVAFTAAQRAYWAGQTQASILNLLQSGDATARAQVQSAIASFLSNPTLVDLVPELANAAGNLVSNSGRLGYNRNYCVEQPQLVFAQFFLVQDTELEDCRQAALEAYDVAQASLDDQIAQQLSDIQAQYDAQLPLVEAQRAGLESESQGRNSIRLDEYLSFYTATENTIATLFGDGNISAAERDLLNIVNLAVYGAYVDTSLTLENDEVVLIDNLLVQAAANLTAERDTLIAQANNNYQAESDQLIITRDNTISFCHNQGGTNIS